jgi:mannose-6-phosphate isomerase
MLYPLTFHPIFKERVWGGRKLEQLYHKPLPPGATIGESWEISDRPGDVNVIANGPLAGKDLHWLMEHHERELLGNARSLNGRFPLLIKLLDAEEKLSLQVHPPANKAAELGGEPKTEMWYIADAAPGAELYAGLKKGVTRRDFEQKIKTGEVAECFHPIPVHKGDVMFLPSGRVHAIGGGLVIFEIQQNSDTTYRVFDWNRVGLDGKPRELHVDKSLASIDFNDFEPSLVNAPAKPVADSTLRLLTKNPLFSVDEFHFQSVASILLEPKRFNIVAALEKRLNVVGIGMETVDVELQPGQFCLIPAQLKAVELRAERGTRFLSVQASE